MKRLDVNGWAETTNAVASHSRLGLTDVLPAEEELSVQIRHFDRVEIDHTDGAKAAQSQGFQEFAADAAGSDHENGTFFGTFANGLIGGMRLAHRQ